MNLTPGMTKYFKLDTRRNTTRSFYSQKTVTDCREFFYNAEIGAFMFNNDL